MSSTIRSFKLPPQTNVPAGDVSMVFSSFSAVEIEVGAGVGWYSIQRAKAFPERALIAIERTHDKFGKLVRRLEHHPQLVNLIPIQADARIWVSSHVPKGSVDHVWIMYPNPNPKNSAERWFKMPFMRKLCESLKSDGKITLATNVDWYGKEAESTAREIWGLSLICKRELGKSNKARSHFEKKYLLRGEACSEWTWVKKP